MRIVFCGTAAFAVPSLRAVAADHDLLAVVTQPDRRGSRGRPAPRPVGAAAATLEVPVLRPERIRDRDSIDAVLHLNPDALVVAAYGQIIPAVLLDTPTGGGVNVHGSLLPRWRGAAPVAAAILHGDRRTGVSVMKMDAGLDTGPVYAERELEIAADDTTPALSERLAMAGAELLVEVLQAISAGGLSPRPQDDERATLAPRLRREDGAVGWDSIDAAGLDRRVRALQPWPGVTVPLAGIRVRVLRGTPAGEDAPASAPAGTIVAISGDAIDVATAAGDYRLLEVQPPGGRPMSAAAFLRGHRPPPPSAATDR